MPVTTVVSSSCASCGAALELECEPTEGFWGYPTYNEFFCPKCGKRNVVRSSGAVLAARLRSDPAAARV